MSTQRGNTSKKRTQKHNNNPAFKNDKYDSSKSTLQRLHRMEN